MTPRAFSDNPQELRVQVLRLRGPLDIEDILKIQRMVKDFQRLGLVRVALNLEHVDHVAFAGFSVLFILARHFREDGGDLKLVAASSYVRHCFELAGLAQDLDFCGSDQEALDHFAGK